MVAPFAGGNLFRDKRIGRVGIGHAQQRFGEAHKRQAFGVREAELLKEAFHHARAAGLGARLEHEAEHLVEDALLGAQAPPQLAPLGVGQVTVNGPPGLRLRAGIVAHRIEDMPSTNPKRGNPPLTCTLFPNSL